MSNQQEQQEQQDREIQALTRYFAERIGERVWSALASDNDQAAVVLAADRADILSSD